MPTAAYCFAIGLYSDPAVQLSSGIYVKPAQSTMWTTPRGHQEGRGG